MSRREGDALRSRRVETWPEPITEEPDIEQLSAWTVDGVGEATDGCSIENDGVCEHGHPAWLKKLGFV